MREIKFRAWDKKNNRMVFTRTIQDFPSISDEGIIVAHKWEKGRLIKTSSFADDLIWLEYTGLKDKNNREIYEGDIVKYADACYPATIVFSDGSFLIKWAEEEMPLRDMEEDIEVIGNIYENPELLEKEK